MSENIPHRFHNAVGISRMSVRHGDTAIALGSGDVPVLGTPRVIALAENATNAAVAELLQQSESTVGVRIELDHLATSSVGDEVVATATVVSFEGRRITFHVECHVNERLIAQGNITRALVDRVSFVAMAAAQSISKNS